MLRGAKNARVIKNKKYKSIHLQDFPVIPFMWNNSEIKNGDGIVQSMLLLKETLTDLTKLQDYQLINV